MDSNPQLFFPKINDSTSNCSVTEKASEINTTIFKEFIPGFGETTWKTVATSDQTYIPNDFLDLNDVRTKEFDDYYYYCHHMQSADLFHKVYFKIREEVIFLFAEEDDQEF